jgi:alcohol dehydrogenase class IV
MSIASLCGGMALANARLGAVHGFAGPISGMFDAPHGAVCARLLPFVTEVNLQALRMREPDNPILQRYAEIARLLTGEPDATAADAVRWLHDLLNDLQIPPLSTYGITESDMPILVEKSAPASSMQGNPIKLKPEEMTTILGRAL